MNKVIRFFLVLGSLLLFFIGAVYQSPGVLLTSTLIILLHNIIYSFVDFYKRVIFFCFNITFFIFLIGRMVVSGFLGYKSDLLGVFGLAFTEKDIANTVIICLYLSVLAIYIGYVLIQKVNLSFLNQKKETKASFMYCLRVFSLLFFYFCMIFHLIYVFQMKQAAMTEGYFESFMDFKSTLPPALEAISKMYDVAFFAYLASNPPKRKAAIPILLYIGEGFLSALAGRRSIFMLNLLIVFIYYCIRSIPKKESKEVENVQEKKWLGKFELILGVVALPVLMVFMTIIGKLRSSNWTTSGNSGFKDSIFEFFYSQGISANLIGYTKLYHDYVPKGKLYTFGPLMEFVDNKMIRPMHGMPDLAGQNIDRALNGYLYAHAISYLIMPTAYLMGIGYGSSFVAEMYNDFSYGGVFVGSIVYGAILYLFYYMLRNSNYVVVIFTLMMTRSILFAPRGAALSFIVSSFSMPKIFAVIVIFIGAKALHMLIGEKRFPSLPRLTWK